MSGTTIPRRPGPAGDGPFGTASDAAAAIREQRTSSSELTRVTLERIRRFQPALNCFTYVMEQQALQRAQMLDQALATGRPLGPLHGVPVHVKESYAVAGQPCTWGLPPFRDARPAANADVVDRLLEAGAVLVGGTNVPASLSDQQTFNDLFGTTCNPWDVRLTPGGSSGGSAAALAAGLGYLSVGSDLGGSLRVPSHFCGILTHKPSLDLVSQRGQAPGGRRRPQGFSDFLSVSGPMARSAADLELALGVLGGADKPESAAWTWRMPAPRAKRLRDFRVGVVLDDASCPLASDTSPALLAAVAAIERAGARISHGWPEGFDAAKMMEAYLYLMRAFLNAVAPPAMQAAAKEQLAGQTSSMAQAILGTFADWHVRNLARLEFRAMWQRHFEQVDVVVMPVAFTAAFPHDHGKGSRQIATPEGPRRYWDLFQWIVPATLSGCPATIVPVGHTADGRPVGLQVMGPLWEDATPLRFAALLERELGGFEAPPGYD
jgi:amidase